MHSPTFHVPPYAVDAVTAPNPCFIPAYPSQQPMVTHADLFFNEMPCFLGYESLLINVLQGDLDRLRSRVTSCLTPIRDGATFPQRAVWLLGDSHSGAISPGMLAALDGTASVRWMGAGFGCTVDTEAAITAKMGPGYGDDGRRWDWQRDSCITYNQQIDVVLSSNARACDVIVIHHMNRARTATQINEYRQRLQGLATLAESKGAQLVLMGDVPRLRDGRNAAMCVGGSASACLTSRAEVEAQHQAEKDLYLSLVASNPNTVRYLQLWDKLCDNNQCGAYVPGTTTLAYADNDHLSNAGATYFYPFMCAWFLDNGLVGE